MTCFDQKLHLILASVTNPVQKRTVQITQRERLQSPQLRDLRLNESVDGLSSSSSPKLPQMLLNFVADEKFNRALETRLDFKTKRAFSSG